MKTDELPLIQPEGRVLSTLDSDGHRRWMLPKLSKGRFWSRRRLVAYALVAVYASLPFIRVNGMPAMQLDILNREFTFFGFQFLATDLELLALLVPAAFLSIFFATAVLGRVWCGWGCPQTVYLEFVFRPIERFFTGTVGKGGEPKKEVAAWRLVAMYLTFLVICWHLCNTFLAYFVGVDKVHEWIWTAPPWEHPGAFAMVVFVTGLMMFDFCYWREQLCIIGCPYGRFQSVMLDRSSMIVGYDNNRGEPRGRGRDRQEKGLGSCVDCGMCVDVCPTGIDIRDGLQLECVNCAQCIDACDAVMDRLKAPRGLIRYGSQMSLDGEPTKVIRPRILIYTAVICVLISMFITLLLNKPTFEVTLLRGMGMPFRTRQNGEVENVVRVKIVNRTDVDRTYRIETPSPEGVLVEGSPTVTIKAGEMVTEPVHVVGEPKLFAQRGGTLEATFRITDNEGVARDTTYRLFGPAVVKKKADAASKGASDDTSR